MSDRRVEADATGAHPRFAIASEVGGAARRGRRRCGRRRSSRRPCSRRRRVFASAAAEPARAAPPLPPDDPDRCCHLGPRSDAAFGKAEDRGRRLRPGFLRRARSKPLAQNGESTHDETILLRWLFSSAHASSFGPNVGPSVRQAARRERADDVTRAVAGSSCRALAQIEAQSIVKSIGRRFSRGRSGRRGRNHGTNAVDHRHSHGGCPGAFG